MKKLNVNEMRAVNGGIGVGTVVAGWLIGRAVGKGLYRLTHNGRYPG